jgi:hypothetical protein
MRTLLKAGAFWLNLLLPFVCLGQDPLGVLPMQYNGSFAGETGRPRINSGFTFKPFDRASNYTYYNLNVSYDQFISSIRSGIGVTASYGGGPGYIGRGIGLAIAPKFSFKGKYTLSPSLDFQYGASSFNADGQYVGLPPLKASHYTASRAGLLFNTDKFYIGYSANVYTQYTYRFANDSSYTEPGSGFSRFLNSTLQMGYTFQKNPDSKFCFTPQLAFALYNNASTRTSFRVQAYNFTFKYQQFVWGINGSGLAFNDYADLSVHVGWQTKKLRLMLSNGLPAIRREPNRAPYSYIGNLSFRYAFGKDDQ